MTLRLIFNKRFLWLMLIFIWLVSFQFSFGHEIYNTKLNFKVKTKSFFPQDSLKNKVDYSKQKDLKDVIKKIFNIKKRPEDSLKIDLGNKTSLSILPGISYNPATSVIFGVSLSVTRYFGDPANTSNSTVSSGVSYSLKKQFKLSVQSNIFSNKNNWSIQGDWRLWKFVQNTYGLGTGTVKSSEQNMKFNLIRLNENILKRVVGNLYAGIGYSLDYYYRINTIDSSEQFIYPNIHNTYSKLHGFDSTDYLSSGVVLDLYFDSRDNTVNAYKGVMMDAKYYNYNKAIGSTSNWQKLDLELRAFQSLTKNNSYRLGLWLMGNIILNGRVPYMSLPSNGWDKYNSTARGYIQGRFRGRDLLYAELENRIDLTKNGLLGLVIFGNAITISNPDDNVKLFDYIEPAGGVGLRIKFDKFSRTNISVDYARGKNSSGIFLAIGEFF